MLENIQNFSPPGADAELHDKILPIPPQCPCTAPSGSPGPPDKNF